jgi:hypothetical protein
MFTGNLNRKVDHSTTIADTYIPNLQQKSIPSHGTLISLFRVCEAIQDEDNRSDGADAHTKEISSHRSAQS